MGGQVLGAGQQDNNKKTLGYNKEKGVTGVWNLNNEIASENNIFQHIQNKFLHHLIYAPLTVGNFILRLLCFIYQI